MTFSSGSYTWTNCRFQISLTWTSKTDELLSQWLLRLISVDYLQRYVGSTLRFRLFAAWLKFPTFLKSLRHFKCSFSSVYSFHNLFRNLFQHWLSSSFRDLLKTTSWIIMFCCCCDDTMMKMARKRVKKRTENPAGCAMKYVNCVSPIWMLYRSYGYEIC